MMTIQCFLTQDERIAQAGEKLDELAEPLVDKFAKELGLDAARFQGKHVATIASKLKE